MKAVVVKSPGVICVEDVPEISPSSYEVKVKVLACGLCNATDTKVIAGTWKGCENFPFILGHETVGEVISCGEKVRNYKVGQRVLQVRVEGYPELGIGTAWGGLTEYALATDCNAMLEDGLEIPNQFFRVQQVVPNDMSIQNAVMLITLKEVYSALVSLGFKKGQSILILGDGPVGILMAESAMLLGATHVVVCGHHNSRLSLAKRAGATYTINSKVEDLFERAIEYLPEKYDCIIDAVGSNTFLESAVKLIKENGIIGIYGYSNAQRIEFDLHNAPSRFDVRYMITPDIDTMVSIHDELVDAIMAGKTNPAQLISKVFGLAETNTAFSSILSRESLKVIIDIANVL